MFEQDIVAVDILVREIGDDERDYLSVVHFYPRESATVTHAMSDEKHSLVLKLCQVLSMERLREEHLLLICNQVNDLDLHDPDLLRGNRPTLLSFANIIHVPTRQVIQCVQLPDATTRTQLTFRDTPQSLVICCCGDTIGVGVWWKGVVMTGTDVRSVGDQRIKGYTATTTSSERCSEEEETCASNLQP
jgi:hypothetical protein